MTVQNPTDDHDEEDEPKADLSDPYGAVDPHRDRTTPDERCQTTVADAGVGVDVLDLNDEDDVERAPCERCDELIPVTASPCPDCGGDLEKPPAGKVRCSNCYYVVNGRNNDHELRDFGLSYRQARQFLCLFGYDAAGTPGTIGTRLRRFCSDQDVDHGDLGDFLGDLRDEGDSDD